MRLDEQNIYLCPASLEPLTLSADSVEDETVLIGELISRAGKRYPIHDGVPDFTYPFQLTSNDHAARQMYEDTADTYDEYLPLTFMTFNEDESKVRNHMVNLLELNPEARVLEMGCGTGRDSEYILERLNSQGRLYLQDISPSILNKCRNKFLNTETPIEYSIANGSYLPFPDNYFDAAYHFGGLNTFDDIGRAFAEMTRVTKVGGKVVMGDESMPVWLRETEFAKVLMNSNVHYKYPLPLEHLPVEARSVNLRWILGDVFYVIDYVVGEGEPTANLDFEIPGVRGGTHLTRYYGHLEGFAPETKELALAARTKSGKSMHKWLDEVIKQAAQKELGKE